MGDYLGIVVMAVLALSFVGVSLGVSALLAPKRPTPEKLDAYECGIVSDQESVERFPVQFYLVAMIFIAFDVEIIFLYPWAVRMRALELFGFFEMALFVVVLLIAYAYILREGVLDWAPKRTLDRETLMQGFRVEADRAKAALSEQDRGRKSEAA